MFAGVGMRRIHAARHGVRYGLADAWARWKAAAVAKRKHRKFVSWLKTLRSSPPEVLVGGNINVNDGIRHHLLGIVRYSSLRVELAPPDDLRDSLSYGDFHTTFREEFLDFVPTGVGSVHSHVYPYFIEWCRAHRDSGVNWVHTYHSPYFPAVPGRDLEPWQREINDALINDARHAHVRISVARWQQAYLEKVHGIETIYIPNGVDVELCDAGDAARFVEKFGKDPFVLFVGRIEPVKNPADFVRLARHLPDRKFVMIGRGLSAESLRDYVDVIVPPNVVFTGDVPRAEVQDAIAASSVVVITSQWEGLPTVALEAMAHRKPVVVPDNAGCMESVGGGEFGFIYHQGDIDDLLEKTLAAAADTERCAKSRERVLAEYDWRVVAPKLDAVYRGSPIR